MFKVVKKELEWGGRKLTIETGKIARQADGAVLVTYGGTVVLCTAVAQKKVKEGVDFFPLTVNYQEKTFAVGRIPGGFFKREGRPSEKATLTSRLIDRPIRPLFPKGFYNETQVICTVLSHDLINDPDIVALIGASAALAISGIPFEEAIAGARVGYVDGEYVLNPLLGEDEILSKLDLVVAGTKGSVLMVESEASILSEEIMLGAVEFGHKEMQPVIKMINELAKKGGKKVWTVEKEDNSKLEAAIKKLAEKDIKKAYATKNKQARSALLDEAKAKIVEKLFDEGGDVSSVTFKSIIKKLEQEIVRGDLLKTDKRIDGRAPNEIRAIESEVGILGKTHGSALFTRGETQAVVVTTLGTSQDMQIIDSLEGEAKERFMLHYNFPPYCVGEASMMRAPGRREIGHGKLASRALAAVLPSLEDFPYAIRVVSEITESNGSSSMATVCGGSMSMMEAGVPISASVAGIAMGLILEGKNYVVLSDIMGDEDHLGDMDFKVAGTEQGITALQMDIKVSGVTIKIMKEALKQAKVGRMEILKKMSLAIKESREELNVNAPSIKTMKIATDKIRDVIGSGGKVIRSICEESGAKVEIEDDGTIRIAAVGKEAMDKALQLIKDVAFDPEIGKVYDGLVVKVVEFGAFVRFMGAKEGLVHISEIVDEKVNKVEDHINEGDTVKVKVLGIDQRGKIKLSMKYIDQKTGDDSSAGKESKPSERSSNRPERGDRPPRRSNDRGERKTGSSERSSGGNDRSERSDNDRDRKSSSPRQPRANRDRDVNKEPQKTEKRKYFNY
jgi:polyribonucleotide nucleotidyltransferase